jgi:hypothetical protein
LLLLQELERKRERQKLLGPDSRLHKVILGTHIPNCPNCGT